MVQLEKSFCEEFMARYAMGMRLAIAIELVRRYGYSQLQAARLAGVSQPLLNYVLNNRRKPRHLYRILSDKYCGEVVAKAAELLASNKRIDMCMLCELYRRIANIPGPCRHSHYRGHDGTSFYRNGFYQTSR